MRGDSIVVDNGLEALLGQRVTLIVMEDVEAIASCGLHYLRKVESVPRLDM